MATRTSKKPRRKVDPNQLSLLDYAPAAKAPKTASGTPPRRIASPPTLRAPLLVSVLTAKEAADYLRVSLATLKSWRAKKIGPTFIKRGARLIGYKPADLEAYMMVQARK